MSPKHPSRIRKPSERVIAARREAARRKAPLKVVMSEQGTVQVKNKIIVSKVNLVSLKYSCINLSL
jgi:hypothetical protein